MICKHHGKQYTLIVQKLCESMARPIGFSVSTENMEWCERELAEGRYETFSEIIEFAMRLLLLEIRNGAQPVPRRHGKRIRKTVRVNDWVLDQLMGTDMFDRADIADFALWTLRMEWDGDDGE